jgi:hypothetical protein
MTQIYLLDPRSEIFQSFITPNQLYSFAQRSTRNFRGKVVIVRNGDKAKAYNFGDESPTEVFAIVSRLLTEIL